MDWQPIETAPTDQEKILVACVFDDGSVQMHVASRWAGGWGTWGFHSYQPIIDPAPTHWMTLPEPPAK
jgi:hypothetical protein